MNHLDLVAFQQFSNIVAQLPHDLIFSGHHGREIELHPIDQDPMIRPGGFSPCDSASLESSRALLGIQPMLRHTPPSRGSFSTQTTLKPELSRTNAGHITTRAGADDAQIVTFSDPPYYISSMIRSGFSTHSLMRFRKETASRPSIMR